MLAVDTNVVVRLLTKDDPGQYRKALRLFRGEEVFLPWTVLLEVEWVLRHAYGIEREAVIGALRGLLGRPNVRVRDPHALAAAIDWHEEGLDLADALHLAGSQDCARLMTFDGRFVRRGAGLGRCRVERP